jgi:hypothetical protein
MPLCGWRHRSPQDFFINKHFSSIDKTSAQLRFASLITWILLPYILVEKAGQNMVGSVAVRRKGTENM